MKTTLLTQILPLLILLAGCLPFAASAQTITITGTSEGSNIICLSEGDDFDILLELDGTFPEDVIFTAFAGPVEIGTATGNDITSISIMTLPGQLPVGMTYSFSQTMGLHLISLK